MAHRGRNVAIVAAVSGIVLIAGAAIASKDRIREEWYFHVLRSGYAEEKLAAARRLGELRSVRAVPRLIEAYGSIEANTVVRLPSANEVFQEALRSIGEPALPALVRALSCKLNGPPEKWDYVFIDEALERIYLKKTRPRPEPGWSPDEQEAEVWYLQDLKDLLEKMRDDALASPELREAAAECVKPLVRWSEAGKR